MTHTFQLFQFLFILLLFAGTALFILKKMKKRQLNRTSEKGTIKIQDVLQLGLNEQMYVVTIGKERILLFKTANAVEMEKLENFTEEEQKKFEEMYENTPTMTEKVNQIRKGLRKA